ncbi:MAG: AEC family transporter [Clostridia bacterium]|nr:AEC family transporter [Clostridia bacterium]
MLAKSGLVEAEHAKLLSTLEVYVCFPCTVFKTFSANFTVSYLSEKYASILLSTVLLAAVAVIARVVSRRFSKNPYEQDIYCYTMVIPNTGYIGSALVGNLYGQTVLLNQMLFNLPVTFYTYTEGYRMLTGGKKMTLKRLINPVMIALMLGCVVGILSIPIPAVLQSVVDGANNCMAPLSMILTGIAISEFDLRKLLKIKMVYVMTLIRLIILPFGMAFLVSRFCSREIVLAIVMQYAMPCGLNTIVFPKLIGENCEIGAGLALVSNVLAIFTIPLCVAVFL